MRLEDLGLVGNCQCSALVDRNEPRLGWSKGVLAPLYRIDGSSDLKETMLLEWAGHEGNQPVRVGNAAAEHTQNDIFGEMVLALAPVYLDERFQAERSAQAFDLLTGLARRAVKVAGTPDAGIWEYRTDWKPQTFSTLMCWAGADRMARVAAVHKKGLQAPSDGDPPLPSAWLASHPANHRRDTGRALTRWIKWRGVRSFHCSRASAWTPRSGLTRLI